MLFHRSDENGLGLVPGSHSRFESEGGPHIRTFAWERLVTKDHLLCQNYLDRDRSNPNNTFTSSCLMRVFATLTSALASSSEMPLPRMFSNIPTPSARFEGH